MNDQEKNFGILLSDQNGKASKNQLKLVSISIVCMYLLM